MSEEIENQISAFLKRCDDNGNTLLHYIAKSDNEEFAEKLIAAGCDVNAKNTEGDVPLSLAVKGNQLKMVKIFLNAGANFGNNHFAYKRGPLHTAAESGCPEIVLLLKKMTAAEDGCSKNYKNAPRHVYICSDESKSNNHCKNLKSLIDADGADAINDTLLNAVDCTLYAGFKLMLSRGVDIRVEGNMDFNFTSEAVWCDNFDLLARLMELGYNVNMPDVNGNTCLHIAALLARSKMIEFLLNNGALIKVNNNGFDPLCYALQDWIGKYKNLNEISDYHDQEIEEGMNQNDYINHMKCLDVLIKGGTNVNHMTNNWKTPLYIILQHFRFIHSNFVRVLLKNGATFNFEHPVVREVLDNSNESKFPYLLLRHTALFEAQGREDEPENFDVEKLSKESRKVYVRCRDELELMKATKIYDTNVTFFNVLVNRDISPYTRNQNVKNVFETSSIVSKRFPMYGDLLTNRFSEELEYQSIVQKATDVLGRILNWDINSTHIPLSNIIRYLDRKDLTSLALINKTQV